MNLDINILHEYLKNLDSSLTLEESNCECEQTIYKINKANIKRNKKDDRDRIDASYKICINPKSHISNRKYLDRRISIPIEEYKRYTRDKKLSKLI